MGRTVTPFSIVLRQEESRLKKFRRALALLMLIGMQKEI
jgi:hypothetical protein